MRELIPLLNILDMDASLAFYRDLLGFSVAQHFEHAGRIVWARLENGDVTLMLNVSAVRADREPRGQPRSYDDVLLCVRVDDLRRVHAALVAGGASPGELCSEDYGLDEFTVRDPDGYELAFQQPSARS